jgi:hypothetical protein
LRGWAAFVGEDDNREIQVGAGECQVALAFRGGHDAGQQIELALFGLLSTSVQLLAR